MPVSVPAQINGAKNFQSSGLRNKIDQLMDVLWAGGVNNPMDSIEQLSYLLFLRLLTEKDEQRAVLDRKYKRIFADDWARFAWSNFVTLTGDDLYNTIRDSIEKLHELPSMSDTGKVLFNRATLKIYDRPTLRATVQGIQEMDLAEHDGLDFKGDMYEYLLSKLAVSGTNGQFRSPRHIIAMIVALVDPQSHQRICDPAVGTAGFHIAAFNHILAQNSSPASLARGRFEGDLLKPAQWKFLEEQAFTGFDNDANMVKIAILNLYLHGLEKARIQFFNPLTTSLKGGYPGETFDVMLANPPFAGSIQKESILADLNLPTRDTELLFLKWFIDHLNPGGRGGVIVPNGVLFGSTKAARKVREMLLSECDLQAVINLPSGVFKPYSGVGTAVLVFEKLTDDRRRQTADKKEPRSVVVGHPSDFVWFYDLTADGFSLDDKRTPSEQNDIPDVLAKFPTRAEGANSFRVAKSKIIENDYFLNIGRYKPVTIEATQHDAPKKILREVVKLEEEIAERARALTESLKR